MPRLRDMARRAARGGRRLLRPVGRRLPGPIRRHGAIVAAGLAAFAVGAAAVGVIQGGGEDEGTTPLPSAEAGGRGSEPQSRTSFLSRLI
ncbi:MAG TPA: hypothetical protein VNT32_13735, partial [Thermoleophilaceae bacterium]|nr:hypothetical protein [Thermoleophilaceae bacterium]